MEKEQSAFSIDGDWLATATPNEGGEFKRMALGDYRFKVISAEPKPKKGDKPHVMLKLGVVAIAAYGDAPEQKESVGMQIDGLYAGSKESPKFMKDRLACIVRACKVQVQPGKMLNPEKDLVGREFDGTVYHELSDPVFDEATGMATKRYVNPRLCGERPVGSTRSTSIDPVRMSAAATAWLAKTYGDAADDVSAEAAPASPPWEQPQAQEAAQPIQTQTGYKPESEIGDLVAVYEYRAFYKLNTPMAEQAKAALIEIGFDPEGPVLVEKLTPQTRDAYLAKFPQTNGSAPSLPALAPLSAPTSKKGQRAPK